jgi:hypothetical protein
MIVKTNNPIVYSNAFGDGALRDKLKGFVAKAKGSGGLMDKAKGLLGGLGGGGQQSQTQTTVTPPPPPPKPKGMSKNLKIGLIVGGSLLVLTVVTIIIVKSKNK